MTAKCSRRPEEDADAGIDVGQAYARALKLLARREHSIRELRGKLAARGVASSVLDQVLERLTGEGLLDEQRFVDVFVRARVERGYGPLKVRADLLARGIDGGLSAQQVDWAAVARSARTRRFGDGQPKDYRERARQARFLQQRGFESDQVRAAFKAGDD
jgi:regulatory protein